MTAKQSGDDGDSLGIKTPPAKPLSQADRLREIGESVRLFHTPTGDAYADIPTADGGIDTCPVKSGRFKRWITSAYVKKYRGGFSNNAWQEAINAIDAIASTNDDAQEVHLRIGSQDGALYLDLCDQERRVVKINRERWEVIPAKDAPVRFRRTDEMLAEPLPMPERGGRLDDLFHYINVPDEEGRVLVRAFLMALLHPTGPYVCLALAGEQGSAKSCAARYIRSIVDPSDTPTTGAPKDVETAYLQANMNWCPVFDNVHEVRQWLADVLCQLCTGAGYTKRTHFENVDMWTLKAKRPFILTSIADAITQSDLLERTMTVRLPAIPKGSRRDERTLDAEFATARPGILGALLDAVVLALKDSPSVVIPELPRMADIAQWVQAAEPALGQTPGDFVRALAGNQVDSYQAVLEANLVAQAVIKLMQYQKRLEGTSSQIAEMLKNVMLDRESMRPPLGWPRTPAAITSQLKLAVPALRDREGIEIDFGRDKHAARITISKGGDGVDGVERNRKFSLLEDEAMEAAFHR